jgi:uncharacterized protein (DUF1697 family)
MTLIGFLRGINVGGHHKVPMAELRTLLEAFGCGSVRTLLNSGNIAFDTQRADIQQLEQEMEAFLSQSFGFPIPVILKSGEEIQELVAEQPFAGIDVHKDIRLYVTFLKSTPSIDLPLPYLSEDSTYTITSIRNNTILSILDLSTSSTPKGMDMLEKLFGKNLTTRNWNTIVKVSSL